MAKAYVAAVVSGQFRLGATLHEEKQVLRDAFCVVSTAVAAKQADLEIGDVVRVGFCARSGGPFPIVFASVTPVDVNGAPVAAARFISSSSLRLLNGSDVLSTREVPRAVPV